MKRKNNVYCVKPAEAVEAEIRILDFTPKESEAEAEEIRGNLADCNTPENPQKIMPAERRVKCEWKDGVMRYVFPGHSFSILKLRQEFSSREGAGEG